MENKNWDGFFKDFINFFIIVFFVLLFLDLYIPFKKKNLFGVNLSYKEVISYLNPKEYIAPAFWSALFKAIYQKEKSDKKASADNSQEIKKENNTRNIG